MDHLISCLVLALVAMAMQSAAVSIRRTSRDSAAAVTHNNAADTMATETASDMNQLDKLRKDYTMLLDKMITVMPKKRRPLPVCKQAASNASKGYKATALSSRTGAVSEV